MSAIRVSRRGAARFALAKQGLLETNDGFFRPWREELKEEDGVLAAIRRLEGVQIDPVALVERNHHLVLWNRVGGYDGGRLDALLASGHVFEHWANARCFLPMDDYPIFWWRMRDWAEEQEQWRRKLGDVPKRIVAEIRENGPRTSRSIESDEKVLGYWDSDAPRTKATTLALEFLWEAGELMITERNGIEKVYDVPERIVREELRRAAAAMSREQAYGLLLDKYCRAYGLFDTGDFRFGWRKIAAADRRALVERRVADGELVPVDVEGVRRKYYVLTSDATLLRELDKPGVEVAPRVFILPPLDSALWRRERLQDLFEFNYSWEIYLPAAKRRFGPYVMPILRGDSFVGRVNPRLDRDKGLLAVEGLWLEADAKSEPGLLDEIESALNDLARFVGAAAFTSTRAAGSTGTCQPG